MKNDVFITGTSSYFPNNPVSNEDMEDFLGLIAGKHSRVKPIILKQNGIKQRYYALTKSQEITHSNAEMAVLSIRQLLQIASISESDIELLTCATSSPDQMLPSHASMVHGLKTSQWKYSLLQVFVYHVSKLSKLLFGVSCQERKKMQYVVHQN